MSPSMEAAFASFRISDPVPVSAALESGHVPDKSDIDLGSSSGVLDIFQTIATLRGKVVACLDDPQAVETIVLLVPDVVDAIMGKTPDEYKPLVSGVLRALAAYAAGDTAAEVEPVPQPQPEPSPTSSAAPVKGKGRRNNSRVVGTSMEDICAAFVQSGLLKTA